MTTAALIASNYLLATSGRTTYTAGRTKHGKKIHVNYGGRRLVCGALIARTIDACTLTEYAQLCPKCWPAHVIVAINAPSTLEG